MGENTIVEITRRIELDYGHTLPNHYSFCNQIHGHRAFVEATVSGDLVTKIGASSQGMVLDFKFLKETMMDKIHGILDHGFAVWNKDKQDLDFITSRNEKYLVMLDPPTAENLAKWAYNQIVNEIPNGIKLVSVKWWETPNSVAEYKG